MVGKYLNFIASQADQETDWRDELIQAISLVSWEQEKVMSSSTFPTLTFHKHTEAVGKHFYNSIQGEH